MKFENLGMDGVFICTPTVFRDERGCFYESFNYREFTKQSGLQPQFVQDNHSVSRYGVLRGLHFQQGEYAQAKLVRVFTGAVLDCIVDLRSGSKTYGQYIGVHLSADTKQQLFVPRGFAHGFVVLSEYAEFGYKCDNYYHKEAEGGLRWNDPTLAIDWRIPETDVVVSSKDAVLPHLSELDRDLF